jgi:hypothetical protein
MYRVPIDRASAGYALERGLKYYFNSQSKFRVTSNKLEDMPEGAYKQALTSRLGKSYDKMLARALQPKPSGRKEERSSRAEARVSYEVPSY